jgi:hypothetical protein
VSAASRPLRYRGRLNRRGRNAVKRGRVRYLNPGREPIGYSFCLDDLRWLLERQRAGWRKATTMRAAEDVREGAPVAIDDFGRAYRAGGDR